MKTYDPHQRFGRPQGGWREKLYAVIFESDTPAGMAFDLALIGAILLSVTTVVLASVSEVARDYGDWLFAAEWFFTALFTLEYVCRLLCVRHPLRYARSFFGMIDLLAVLPSYMALILPGAHVLLNVRILRLLRMFRILKLTLYIEEYGMLGRALLASRRKILIFLSVVFMIVFLLGDHHVCGGRADAWLHQHPDFGLLGDLRGDHGGLRRPGTEDRPGARHCFRHDAAGVGHSCGPDRHHQRRNQPAAPLEPYLRRLPGRGP